MRLYLRLLLGLIGRTLRSRNDLLMENLVLRQQLAVYTRRQTRPSLRDEDRVSGRSSHARGDRGALTFSSFSLTPSSAGTGPPGAATGRGRVADGQGVRA